MARLRTTFDTAPWRRYPTVVLTILLLADVTAARADPIGRTSTADAEARLQLIPQIQTCWLPPPGVSELKLEVRIKVSLKPDGSLAELPQATEVPSHPIGPAYAASVIRAIRRCAPYRLPPEKYQQWHDVILTFVSQTL